MSSSSSVPVSSSDETEDEVSSPTCQSPSSRSSLPSPQKTPSKRARLISSSSSTRDHDDHISSSSDEEISPKKQYKYAEPEVPPNPVYWPTTSSVPDATHSLSVSPTLGGIMQLSASGLEETCPQAIPDSQGNGGEEASQQAIPDSQGNGGEEASQQAIPDSQGNGGEEASQQPFIDSNNRVSTAEPVTLSSSSGDESSYQDSSDEGESHDGDSVSSNNNQADSSVCSSSDDAESVKSSDNSDSSVYEHDSSDDDDLTLLKSTVHLFEGSDLSVDESVLLIMNKLFIKNKLSKKVVGEILEVILKMLPKENNLPKSRHLLFKHVLDASPMPPEIKHFYCQVCQCYLGKEAIQSCTLCQSDDVNHFFQLPIAQQIKTLFEVHDLADIIDKYQDERNSRVSASKSYSDVCDGSEYERASCKGRYDLVLVAHTDGVSISESSAVSLWPLEYTICELPPILRVNFLLISGIWVDKSKPDLNVYLKPFADELNDLFCEGVKWTHPKTKEEHITRVVAPCLCGDAPVRADVQNIHHHGGRFCCHSCEQKMTKIEIQDPNEPESHSNKKKTKRVFLFQEEASKLRTDARMRAQAERALTKRRSGVKDPMSKGVKGLSVFSKFPECDVSTVVYPEYMHVIYDLIKKVFCKLWFETKPRDPWSLRNHVNAVNSFIKSLKVPDFVTRSPKTVDLVGEWKAHECRFFLLFSSLVAFSDCMTPVYLEHWMLFVHAMYLLLQESVSVNDVDKSEILLRLFLRDFTKLYRPQDFVYNLHCLQHFALSVRRWGPCPTTSAFKFEDYNDGSLSKCIHGRKNQAKELLNTIQLYEGVKALEARVKVSSSSCVNSQRNRDQFRNKIVKFPFSHDVKNVLENSKLVEPVLYCRALIRGGKFTSNIYQRQKKNNNFTVCYLNELGKKEYGEVMCYCVDKTDLKLALLNSLTVKHSRTFVHSKAGFVVKHLIPVKKSLSYVLVPLENIVCKVIRLGDFVGLRPNSFEVNL